MKAVCWMGKSNVEVHEVADPKILNPHDCVIKVTRTAICGSDLHLFDGYIPTMESGDILGHEFMGIVEETGSEVNNLKRGDRVVVPFPIACGCCFFCQHQLPGHCENSNPEKYGPEGALLSQKGGALFGYTDLYGGYQGGQAEYVRVPYADYGPRKVPEHFSDEQVLFLTDIFPTGYSGVDWAGVKGGETVAVFGCGPVGLMAMKSAWLRGAKRVIGVDIKEYRCETARRTTKSEIINATKANPVQAIRDMTDGRGADLCIDAVGMEADRTVMDKLSNIVHLQAGSIKSLEACFSAVRRGGAVSILGVYGMPYDNFPIGQIFDKGITIYSGQAPAHKHIETLFGYLDRGEVQLEDIISHRLKLEDAAHGYDIFSKKEDDCVKVVMTP